MSETGAFNNLFSPFSLGHIRLRNRIVLAPHNVVFLGGHGDTANRIINYFAERAKGGAGLIVMTNFMVPKSWLRLGSWGGTLPVTPLGVLNMLNDTSSQDAYRKLCAEIKSHGAHFIAQINAGGRQYGTPGTTEFGLPLLAPSAIPCPRTRTIPKPMTRSEITEFVETFAISARRVQQFGGDGVEIFAAQGYLLSSFLSPLTNRREDDYGGNLHNRMRILHEVIDAIRATCGTSFVVGVRMNGRDGILGGTTLEESIEIAKVLGAGGQINYLNVSGLTYADFPAWIADMNTPEAHFSRDAGEIRLASRLPVCVVSRIHSPDLAEQILERGEADLVGMARALISDPYLPRKAMNGDVQDIRGCTYCNQTCLMGWEANRGVGCLHNPAVGKEEWLGEGKVTPAAPTRRVIVVGGGPAGLTAARVAAERGHEVILLEKSDELGGQNRYTAMMAARHGFAEVTRWLRHRLDRLNVDVQLNTSADPDSVLSLSPDAVIVATGSVPRLDGFTSARPERRMLPGLKSVDVLSAIDVFTRPQTLGKRTVLIDDDPHLTGIYVAEHVASLGSDTTIVTPHIYAGRELAVGHIPPVYRRLRRAGVTIVTDSVPDRIDGNVLWCVDRFSERQFSLGPVDSLILCTGNIADDHLLSQLTGRVKHLFSAGDCVAPRRLDDAIFDGARVGTMV